MMNNSKHQEAYHAISGTVIDSNPDWSLRIEEKTIIVYSAKTGKIQTRGRETPSFLNKCKEKYGLDKVENLSSTEFLLPGFIDGHLHAPQFPNNGLGLNLPLLEWLQHYTFPMESRFSDENFATKTYENVVDSTLSYGTTMAVYFATIHRKSSLILADIARNRGQRCFVGKVCMNRNSPDNYRETTKESLNETELFVNELLKDKDERHLVSPIITPRFIPSCDPELLQGLGDLALKTKVPVQSHISESKAEVKWVKQLESKKSYARAYDDYGLLTQNSIMAHGIYLTKSEIELFKQTGAGLVHCPNSNLSILSGNMDLIKMRNSGLDKIGLGTDCSGGYSPSMLNAMRFAVGTSKQLALTKRKYKPINFEDAIYLATRGSAKVVSMEDEIGVLEPGYFFDALVVGMGPNSTNKATTLYGHESIQDIVQKFVYLGDDRNIRKVFVHGQCVKSIP